HRIRPVDADESQLTQGLRNGIRILARVSRQGHDWVTGALPDAADARGGKALEDSVVLGVGDFFGCVFCRLPIRIPRTPFHVVDLLAIQYERNAKLDQRPDLALSREDSVAGRSNRLDVASADRRKTNAAWPVDVDHAAGGEIPLQRTRRFLLEVRPRCFGNR